MAWYGGIEDALLKFDRDGVLLSSYISITLYLALPFYSAYAPLWAGSSSSIYPLPPIAIYALIVSLPLFAVLFKYLKVWETASKYNIANRVSWEIGTMPPPPKHLFLMRWLIFLYSIPTACLLYYYVTALLFSLFEGWNSYYGIFSNLIFLSQIILAAILARYRIKTTKSDIIIEKIKQD